MYEAPKLQKCVQIKSHVCFFWCIFLANLQNPIVFAPKISTPGQPSCRFQAHGRQGGHVANSALWAFDHSGTTVFDDHLWVLENPFKNMTKTAGNHQSSRNWWSIFCMNNFLVHEGFNPEIAWVLLSEIYLYNYPPVSYIGVVVLSLPSFCQVTTEPLSRANAGRASAMPCARCCSGIAASVDSAWRNNGITSSCSESMEKNGFYLSKDVKSICFYPKEHLDIEDLGNFLSQIHRCWGRCNSWTGRRWGEVIQVAPGSYWMMRTWSHRLSLPPWTWGDGTWRSHPQRGLPNKIFWMIGFNHHKIWKLRDCIWDIGANKKTWES